MQAVRYSYRFLQRPISAAMRLANAAGALSATRCACALLHRLRGIARWLRAQRNGHRQSQQLETTTDVPSELVICRTVDVVRYGLQDQMEAGASCRRWWLTAASEQDRELSCGTDELVTGLSAV